MAVSPQNPLLIEMIRMAEFRGSAGPARSCPANRRSHLSLLFVIGFFLAGCAPSFPALPPEFQTPIPQATLRAYRATYPLLDTRQAVLRAGQQLHGVHFGPAGEQAVLSSERLTLAEARQRTQKPGSISLEQRPADTPVWLVVFRGYTQVSPPDPGPDATPIPPFLGCSYVILEVNQDSGVIVGGIDCPPGLPAWSWPAPTSPVAPKAYP